MADRYALTMNDVVVSKAHDGHELLIVTDDPSDRLSLLFRGHQWSAPYAVARGVRLAGRKGGHLWYTADNATFDYLETLHLDCPGGVVFGSRPVHALGYTRRADGQMQGARTRRARSRESGLRW